MDVSDAKNCSAIDEGTVEAALAEYFSRRDRGEKVELTELIEAYPGCEAGLRHFFAQERRLDGALRAALPAVEQQSSAGRTLGDFKLHRIVGRGGMGVVWEAEQMSLGRPVAVKLLPGALCADPRHRLRFQNEAKILAQMEHPNIVRVIAVGEECDTYYLAMQYVEGITADELVRIWGDLSAARTVATARQAGRSITAEDTRSDLVDATLCCEMPAWVVAAANGQERYRLSARIAAEVADGLAHAHECGVLHRDVKPSNILLDKSGAARLTDFGLARMGGNATLTATGAILGTLRYASPEQLRGVPGTIDARSDVYSLGVTLWELVTGRRFIAGEDRHSVINQVLNGEAPRTQSLNAKVPRDLETIIACAVAKEPADRYESAQAFADDLRRFLDNRAIKTKPIPAIERAFRWANRNRSLATTATASLVVLALVAVTASALILRANSRTATALANSQVNEEKARQSAAAAETSELKTRELLYAADMALAGSAWKKNDPAQVRMILDRYAKPAVRRDGSPADNPRGFEWYFLDRQIRTDSDLLFQNDDALYLIEFMPGGKEFVTAGKDSVVRWHDAATGTVRRSLDTKQGEINSVEYNAAGTLLATAGDDGTLKIWNAKSLSPLHSINVYDGICYFAKFLNESMLITGGNSKVHRLYDGLSGSHIRDYTSPEANQKELLVASSPSAHVSRDGKRFWTAETGSGGIFSGVYEWNVETGESRKIADDRHVTNLFTDASGQVLFVNTSWGGHIRLLRTHTGAEIQSLREMDRLEALALTPDGRHLVAGGRDGQLYFWDISFDDHKTVGISSTPTIISVHQNVIDSVAFAPNDDSLYTVSRDGTVRQTRRQSARTPFRELRGLKNHQCSPIPNSDHVLVACNAPVDVQDPVTGEVVRRFSSNHYKAAAVSSDGKLVAAATPKELTVWNLASGKEILSLDLNKGSQRGLVFSPDNSLLAMHTYDGADMPIDIIELASGKLKPKLSPADHLSWSCFCIDGGLVAWNAPPGQLVCWNLSDNAIRWQTEPASSNHSGGTVSPDQKLLLTFDSRTVALRDCANGDVLYRVPCEYIVQELAFSHDGKSFVTGGDAGQLSVWHTGTGQRLFDLAEIGTEILSIKAYSDGFLVSTTVIRNGKSEILWIRF